jgi:spermidine/putrescine transport system ATP-binding protein
MPGGGPRGSSPRKKVGRDEIRRRVGEVVDLVDLGGLQKRRPAQMSGGQQQRVALARALVNRPRALLLDEPLGALDLRLRKQLQIELSRIQRDVGITFVHVTHDQEEAMSMADAIAVMKDGKIDQLGSAEELYDSPQTEFVANFLGSSNLLDAKVVRNEGELVELDADGARLMAPARRVKDLGDGPVRLGVRPEKLSLRAADDPAPGSGRWRNELAGHVTDASFLGVSTQYVIRTDAGHELSVFSQNAGGQDHLGPGRNVIVAWEPDHTFVVAKETP